MMMMKHSPSVAALGLVGGLAAAAYYKRKQEVVAEEWLSRLLSEAREIRDNEDVMTELLDATILWWRVRSFEDALAACLAHRISCPTFPKKKLFKAFREQFALESATVRADVTAVLQRDPACSTSLEVLLFFKGFAALAAHRVAAAYWLRGEKGFAHWLQSKVSHVCAVDIHPGAVIGPGVMFDHGTGVVIGETARIGEGCTLLHGVTLGGNGKEKGMDRHPKVGAHVLLGACVSVLGNIKIGDRAKIGCGSVVLSSVPSGATAVGAPARIVGKATEAKPSEEGDSSLRRTTAYGHNTCKDLLCVWRGVTGMTKHHHRGKIGFPSFSKALMDHGATSEEIGEIFFEIDSDQDGLVSEREIRERFSSLADRFCACPDRKGELFDSLIECILLSAKARSSTKKIKSPTAKNIEKLLHSSSSEDKDDDDDDENDGDYDDAKSDGGLGTSKSFGSSSHLAF